MPKQTSPATFAKLFNDRKLLLKGVIGLFISGLMFWMLFRFIDLKQMSKLVQTIHWAFCILGFGGWMMLYFFRALRFYLFTPQTPFRIILCIVTVHNLFLRLLPFRTGDLSYAFLIRRVGAAGLGQGMLNLLLMRILDIITVVLIFSITLSFNRRIYLGDPRIGIAVAIGLGLAGLALFISLERVLALGLKIIRYLARWTRLDGNLAFQRLLQKVSKTLDDFKTMSSWTLFKIEVVTLSTWLSNFVAYYFLMFGYSIHVTFAQTVLGATGAVVTSFLPIGGIGSFGTLEAGWALGFVIVGVDRAQAISSGIGTSIITFAYAMLLGISGWLILGIVAKPKTPQKQRKAEGVNL